MGVIIQCDLLRVCTLCKCCMKSERLHLLPSFPVRTQERNMAAAKIQVAVQSFLRRRRAKRQNHGSIIIQSVWRGFVARKRLRLEKEARLRVLQHGAATIIQVGVYFHTCGCPRFMTEESGIKI